MAMAENDVPRADSAPQSTFWLLNDDAGRPVAVSARPVREAHAVEIVCAFAHAPAVQPGGSARAVMLASVDDALGFTHAVLQAVIAIKRSSAAS